MLQKLRAFLSQNRRTIRKQIRTSYTRPFKNWTHSQELIIRHFLLVSRHAITRRNNIRFFGIMFILFFLFRDFAFAAGSPTVPTLAGPTIPPGLSAPSGAEGTNNMNSMIELLNGFLSVVVIIAQPMIMFVGWLLSPDWTFGDVIGLRPILHQMWIYVANIVYVVFAFALIAIAIMNIFGESKNYALKATLPRLIMGILIVPFTWFIVSGILSISNILTASVIQLPIDTIKTTANDKVLKTEINNHIVVYLYDGDLGGGLADSGTISIENLLKSQNGAYNLLPIYAYGIFNINEIKKLTPNQTKDTIKKVADIFNKLTFGTIFAVVFTVLVIAITIALLSRMAMLWVYAIFSPLFALSFFLSGKGGASFKKLDEKMNIMAFISLAMVPVYVAAALSFGLMFISLATNITPGGSNNSVAKISNDCGEECQKIEMGGFSLEMRGNYKDSTGVSKAVFDSGKGMISQVIVQFIGLVVLWMAVMAALGASKITEQAVAPIKSFGDSVGKLLADLPKYTPVKIPGTGGKTMSLQGLQSMGNQISSTISSAAQTQGTQFGSKFGKSLAGALGMEVEEGINKAQEHINSKNISSLTSRAEVGKDLDKVLTLLGKDLNEFSNNPTARGILADRVSQVNNGAIDDDRKKKISDLLKSGTKENVQKAMHEIESALGPNNFGGPGLELNTMDGTEKYFASKKAGTEIEGGKGASGYGEISSREVDAKGTKMTVNGNTFHMDSSGKIDDTEMTNILLPYLKDKKGFTDKDLETWLKDKIGLKDPNQTKTLFDELKKDKDYFVTNETTTTQPATPTNP